ncbi:unnamed protein product [Schistosoma rodhaini]|uniref:SH2 domain-containing protein n=3 Tax=Schistosoma rodhaini TaxID=6188 RepID=A0AA85FH77_9TREM|nr:unnamed protein product [Schistosoma rodhaini]
MSTHTLITKNSSSVISTKTNQGNTIKADLFNASLSTYPSDKQNILNNIDTKITSASTLPVKESIISHSNTSDNLTNYNSSSLQDKKCTMKQDTLITSQPIKIQLRDESKECRIKQKLDLMNASISEQNYNKSHFLQNSRPHICMSPRCPPDGAAVHEISPSNLSKSNKSVIYENLIDKYLLMEHDNHLTKEISPQSLVTTCTVNSVTTTPTFIDNSSNANNHVNNNAKDIMTHRVSTQSTQTNFDIMTVTSTNLLQDSLSTCDSNSKSHLTSESTNSYLSPSKKIVNITTQPQSPTDTNTWFPPPPPTPLRDSIMNSTNIDLKAPHYHEHCRPDEVRSLVLDKISDKSSNIITNLNVSSISELNCSAQISTSVSSITNLKLSSSPPTPPLPPPSSPPHPPSVPPRHPATSLQYKIELTDLPKTVSEKAKNNSVSEKSESQSHQNFPDTGNTLSVQTPLRTSCQNSATAYIPNKQSSICQSDKLTDSSATKIGNETKILTNNSSEMTESKAQPVSASDLDERNKDSTNCPLDGRSVVPWDSNQEDTTVLLSATSSQKTLQANETEIIKSTCIISHAPTITSSTSFPDKRNVNWAFSNQHISTYPLEKLDPLNLDSTNPVLIKKQSVKFHESNRLQNDQKSNVTVTRPNFLSDFILIKSTHPDQPSIKRLISPEDLKNERTIRKHYNITNNHDLNQSVLLQNEEQDEFVPFIYSVKDPTLLNHHNRELLINSHPEIQSNQQIDVAWLKTQQRIELINSNNSRNGIRRSCRDFPQRQISAQPTFTNIQPGVMHLSPTRTHKEHFTSRIPPSSKNSNVLLMTQSSLPAGFPEQKPEYFIHYRHKSDNLVHTNPNFVTDTSSTRMSGDSTHVQYYPQRNRSYNSENSCMTDLIAPSYNSSMTQSVFFPLDSGWGPPDVKSNDSTSSKHKKHRSNMIRSHSQRTADPQANLLEGNQLSTSSDHTRCLIPSKYYHRNLSQTVPANPDSNSIWPPVLVQWHRRRPNVAASSENFPDIIDYQRSKRYNENLHIPAEYYRQQKSDFSRHHSSSTTAISEQLENQLWFHRDLSRSHAEKLLKSTPTGSFLVRRSETSKTELSLSIKRESDVLHMKISQDPETGGYVLGEYSQPYPSVSSMIYRYSRTLLPVRGTAPVLLRFPISRIAFSH